MNAPLVERVARAICRANLQHLSRDSAIIELLVADRWRNYIPEARAAIQAMREPKTRSQKLAEAGFQRRPSAKSLASDE
jgi:hypothetical protein